MLKVGMTGNPHSRLGNFSFSPLKVEKIYSRKTAYAKQIEQNLKEQIKKSRFVSKGEWVNYSKEAENFLISALKKECRWLHKKRKTKSENMSAYKLRKIMEKQGKCPAEVAEESGVSLSTLYRFLSGKGSYYSTQKLLEFWAERQLSK